MVSMSVWLRFGGRGRCLRFCFCSDWFVFVVVRWWLVVILVDGCGYALVFSFSFILAVGYGCHTVVSVARGGGGCGGDGLWFFFFFSFLFLRWVVITTMVIVTGGVVEVAVASCSRFLCDCFLFFVMTCLYYFK